STELKPFAGLTHKPCCAACAHDSTLPQPSPPVPPDPMPATHRRPRQVDTSKHFCPHARCAYRGWLGLRNLRANGHPTGCRWRQFSCRACEDCLQETDGRSLQGKRVALGLVAWAVGALAEGLGILAVARVFEVVPNTVLAWLVEVAEHATAFSRYCLH